MVEIGKVSEDNQSFPLPPLLLLFIQSIARSSRFKQVAIAQALIQAARPQSCLMPLLFGLSVQLDHEFGSEFLLLQLSRLGFSLSYDEVTRFKTSVLQSSNSLSQVTSDDGTATDFSHNFTQYVADNVEKMSKKWTALHVMAVNVTTVNRWTYPDATPITQRLYMMMILIGLKKRLWNNLLLLL